MRSGNGVREQIQYELQLARNRHSPHVALDTGNMKGGLGAKPIRI